MSKQFEQHSPTSLAARVGVTRTALRGALLSGRLPAKKTTIGAREIFTIATADVENYKADVLRKLQARVAKITSDPIRAAEITGSAIANLRRAALAEAEVWTPQRLADFLNCSLERAGWLLQKYATRGTDGFKVTADQMATIERVNEELREQGPLRTSNL